MTIVMTLGNHVSMAMVFMAQDDERTLEPNVFQNFPVHPLDTLLRRQFTHIWIGIS